jgi:hypothetical protein
MPSAASLPLTASLTTLSIRGWLPTESRAQTPSGQGKHLSSSTEPETTSSRLHTVWTCIATRIQITSTCPSNFLACRKKTCRSTCIITSSRCLERTSHLQSVTKAATSFVNADTVNLRGVCRCQRASRQALQNHPFSSGDILMTFCVE